MTRTPHQAFGGQSVTADRPVRGLYVHVPFCFHKCHYCDFYSIVDGMSEAAPAGRQPAFTDRLIGELRACCSAYRLRPRCVFVGGGTPTLLAADLWERLLVAMRRLGVLDDVEEFTVEANPETVTAELAGVLAGGGVNRVSIGAQSFDAGALKTLERWHDPQSVARAVATFRAAGIDNINLDLIFAVPGQSMRTLDADLDAALALGPTHMSCYSLIFEPHTPLSQRMKSGLIKPVDEELERAMYEHVMRRLQAAGFEQYEVSNWARAGEPESRKAGNPSPYRCRHNLLYWRNENWLGIGPSAASHVDGRRWKNQPHLGRYLAHDPPPTVDVEELDIDARVGEALMLGLRLRDGVPLDWLHEHVPADHARRRTIEQMITGGVLETTPTHLRLTDAGVFVADGVVAELL